jgi:hypothetical protein
VALTTPNTIFATDRRLIIRNPTMLGARQNVEYFDYDKITNIKLEKGIFSSTIVLSYPGMDKLAGLLTWGREDDGEIKGLQKDKADNIVPIHCLLNQFTLERSLQLCLSLFIGNAKLTFLTLHLALNHIVRTAKESPHFSKGSVKTAKPFNQVEVEYNLGPTTGMLAVTGGCW